MLRSIALFLALFGVLNLLAGCCLRGFDAANLAWIDLRALPRPLGDFTLLIGCVALLAYGASVPLRRRARLAVASSISILTLICLANAFTFYLLAARGAIRVWMPVPLSLLVAVALVAMVWDLARPHASPRALRPTRRLLVTIGIAVLAFPLGQMLFFGTTDYRRPAGAAVVFGARAYADGRPSDALADRVRAACDLYHAGLVPTLIFSGGPGDGATDEPHAMRDLAMKLGVPDDAIVLDPAGLNTAATVANVPSLLAQHRLGVRRVLAVSHAYHLPRVKLAFARAGIEAFTVPAPQGRRLRAMPRLVAREVAAWWAYYGDARPGLGRT